MIDFDQIALLLLLLAPLSGAVLIMFMPSDRPRIFGISPFSWLLYRLSSHWSSSPATTTGRGSPSSSSLVALSGWTLPQHRLSLGIDGISAPLILLNGIVLFGAVPHIPDHSISHTRLFRTAAGPGLWGLRSVRGAGPVFFVLFLRAGRPANVFADWGLG